MTAVYNRWDRLPEMKQALERWGQQVERIVKGKDAETSVEFEHDVGLKEEVEPV